MIEEVQVRTISRRTRSERTKRRERYLSNDGFDKRNEKILENGFPSPVLSPPLPVNNCLKCGRLVVKKKTHAYIMLSKMKNDFDVDEGKSSVEEKRGKQKDSPAKTSKTKKATSLIKRLKLKSKHSSSSSVSPSEISIEPQPSTSSESPVGRQTPEGDDTVINLLKSASDTNLSESSWKSAENLTADGNKKACKSFVNVESTQQFQMTVTQEGEKALEQRTKSLETLRDMPAYGDLIFDTNLSNTTPVGKPKDHLYKILVIGDLGTGKTSIIKRYVHQFFSQHYRATIGVDFALKVINWDANTLVRLQLWDIAGQERYGNMTRVYYKEAVGAFIVFDVTRVNTFESVTNWKADLDSKVQLPDGSPIPCVLLANKCDQPKEGLINNNTKMNEYCEDKGFTAWFETSAKENINIDDAARALVNKILQNDVLLNNDKGDQFTLSTENAKEKKGCSCKYF